MAGAVGDVVFGTVGHATRLEYTVIGEVVNLVAKLEKHTKSERVRALTTRASYALALEQGYRPLQTPRCVRVAEWKASPMPWIWSFSRNDGACELFAQQ